MNSDKKVIGKCPLCGSDVVKTLKGWACVNSLEQEPKCRFFLFSTVANRRLSDEDASRLITERSILLDGLATKDGKRFSSIVSISQDGNTDVKSQIGTCPKCGGILYVGERAVSCSNYRHPTTPCNFTIWRNTGGHDLTFSELLEIITQGATTNPVTLYDNKGEASSHKLGLNGDKEVTRL